MKFLAGALFIALLGLSAVMVAATWHDRCHPDLTRVTIDACGGGRGTCLNAPEVCP